MGGFDEFLGELLARLGEVLHAHCASAETRQLELILRGDVMRRYSKAQEHAYDAKLRREVVASADHEHRHELRRGMNWLARNVGRHRLIDAALKRPSTSGGWRL